MSDNDGASVALPSGSAIELDKTATLDPAAAGDPLRADAGDTVAYAFAISNTGNTTLSGVTLVDPLADPATVRTVATLAPGATDATSCAFEYVLTQADIDAGGRANSATVSASDPDGATR